MQMSKNPGATWSLTDVAIASGRSYVSVRQLAGRLLPASLHEERAGRGGALQLPEDVAMAMVASLRFGSLNPAMIEAMKTSPDEAMAAANGLATLAKLVANPVANEAA